jgi:hypothetical protein
MRGDGWQGAQILGCAFVFAIRVLEFTTGVIDLSLRRRGHGNSPKAPRYGWIVRQRRRLAPAGGGSDLREPWPARSSLSIAPGPAYTRQGATALTGAPPARIGPRNSNRRARPDGLPGLFFAGRDTIMTISS